MKAVLYDLSGKKKSDISLPNEFEATIREDIALKSFEAEKFLFMQPYSTYEEAGKRHSASGTISHRRHQWKGHYGKGISRLPRKTMWRRGTQFFWIGAEVSSTRGGRVSHPPRGLHAFRKINQKEKMIALLSGFASSFNPNQIKKRYTSIGPEVSSSVIETLPSKSRDLLSAVKNIYGNASKKLIRNKEIRSGIGKTRGRRYKPNAGLLILTSNEEKVKSTIFTIKPLSEIAIRDIYPLGRLILYTKKAVEEISGISIPKEQSSKKDAKQIKQESKK